MTFVIKLIYYIKVYLMDEIIGVLIFLIIIFIFFSLIKFSKEKEVSNLKNDYYDYIENEQWKKWNEIDKWKKYEYEALLNTDEWKNKRKEIFEKRGNKCEWCGCTNHLQLHHKYYLKYPNGEKIEPWDYKDDAFLVLCNYCHEKAHKKYKIKTYYTKKKKI